MDKFQIDNILKLTELESELDLERAIALHGKLRLMVKDDSSLAPSRKHLGKLIKHYEENHWSNDDGITENQIEESDRAELLVCLEVQFTRKRKEVIKDRLKVLGLNQQDLAKLLGHGKSYMSELVNGVRPFSSGDIMLIHRILSIKLEILMSPILKEEDVIRVKKVIAEINTPQLKIKIEDIETKLLGPGDVQENYKRGFLAPGYQDFSLLDRAEEAIEGIKIATITSKRFEDASELIVAP
ncbi:MAG: helix-turn-helix transcriptional regulator [Bacteroidia bacterium]|nr:helix-turn-helix transcriptional regulator [Bacteroidia bacterium]